MPSDSALDAWVLPSGISPEAGDGRALPSATFTPAPTREGAADRHKATPMTTAINRQAARIPVYDGTGRRHDGSASALRSSATDWNLFAGSRSRQRQTTGSICGGTFARSAAGEYL